MLSEGGRRLFCRFLWISLVIFIFFHLLNLFCDRLILIFWHQHRRCCEKISMIMLMINWWLGVKHRNLLNHIAPDLRLCSMILYFKQSAPRILLKEIVLNIFEAIWSRRQYWGSRGCTWHVYYLRGRWLLIWHVGYHGLFLRGQCCQGHLILQTSFYLIQLVTVADGSDAVGLKIYFLSGLKNFAFSYSLVPSLLFILILIAHVRVRLGHMTAESLGFWILFMANRAHVLVVLLLKVLGGTALLFYILLLLRMLR
jgi:hypothetical protein